MNLTFWKSDPHVAAEELIQKSLDVPLSAFERQRLDRHLATCDSCRSAWDDYRRLSRTAEKWVVAASTDPGDEFTQRVMAELGLSAEHTPTVDATPATTARPAITTRAGWAIAGIAGVTLLAVAGIYLPSIGHYQAQLTAYAPSLTSVTATSAWRPETLAGLAHIATASREQISEVLTSVGSMSWPPYAFLVALAANVAMAGVARNRRRAL